MKKEKKRFLIIGGVIVLIIIGVFLVINFFNNGQSCEYKSYDKIKEQISAGMSKSEVITLFGDADNISVYSLEQDELPGLGFPCRVLEVLKYECEEEITVVTICDGETDGFVGEGDFAQ